MAEGSRGDGWTGPTPGSERLREGARGLGGGLPTPCVPLSLACHPCSSTVLLVQTGGQGHGQVSWAVGARPVSPSPWVTMAPALCQCPPRQQGGCLSQRHLHPSAASSGPFVALLQLILGGQGPGPPRFQATCVSLHVLNTFLLPHGRPGFRVMWVRQLCPHTRAGALVPGRGLGRGL